MAGGIFTNIVDQQIQTVQTSVQPIPEVDAFEFLTSSEYLNEDPFPFQRIAFKHTYNLWEVYPPDEEELALIKYEKDHWGIIIDLKSRPKANKFVWVLGRRSTKCLADTTVITDAQTGEQHTLEEMFVTGKRPQLHTLTSEQKVRKTDAYTILYNGEKPCYRLLTRTGKELILTANHPLLTLSGWKEIRHLAVGDRIATPCTLPVATASSTMTLKEARLLGYFIGDGAVAGNLSFTNIDTRIVADFKECVRSLNGKVIKEKTRPIYYPRGLRKGSFLGANPVRTFLKTHNVFGKKSIDKDVPASILIASPEVIGAFLGALFACDGHVSGFFAYSTSSKKLAYQVQHLLLRFGVTAYVKEKEVSYYNDKYKERRFFTSYYLSVNSYEDLERLQQHVKLIGDKYERLVLLCARKRKQSRENAVLQSIPKEVWPYVQALANERGMSMQELRNVSGGWNSDWAPSRSKLRKHAIFFDDAYLRTICDSDVVWDFITEIAPIGMRRTYDLSVEDTHNFVANDIIVHNSTTISMFTTYEMYSLICKGNPQEYYGIREKHPIYIVHMAAASNQAESVFSFSSTNIRKVPFFRPYIDFDKNNSTELRLFTPYDILVNESIKKRNALIARGSGKQKEDLQPGSLNIKSITTTGASNRGDAIKLLIFSELAHVQRAKLVGMSAEESGAEGENPRTDYGIVKAMEPSVMDFGDEGRVVYESSPVEKGGEFYRKYCIAGGPQQDVKAGEIIEPADDYKLMQFATWEVRPTLPRSGLDDEFRSDPVGAEMEYGARFGNPSGQFITDAVVADMFIPNRVIIRMNPGTWHFVISLDPGGKAKKKVADTYALSWGHSEGTNPETEMYYIDGMIGFDAKDVDLGGGRRERVLVDPNAVIKFVLDLCEDFGGKSFVHEIVYDQFDSCLVGGTLIDTNYGLLTIDQIMSEFSKKSFLVNINGVQKRLKNIWFTSVRDVWKVRTKFGYEVSATGNHRLRTYKRTYNLDRSLKVRFTDVDHLTTQQYCCIQASVSWPTSLVRLDKFKHNAIAGGKVSRVTLPLSLDKRFARFLGYLTAEGSISGTTINFSNIDRALLDDFAQLTKSLFNIDIRYCLVNKQMYKSTSIEFDSVSFISREVTDLLCYVGWGSTAAEKAVPWSILQSPKEVCAEFLRAYFEGDGGTCQNEIDLSVKCYSVSERLVREIQILLTKFGIVSSRHSNVNRTILLDGSVFSHVMWTVVCRGSNIRKYLSQIGFVSKRKKRRLLECVQRLPKENQQSKKYFREDDVYRDRVEDISYNGIAPVYDLEIDSEEHTFLANAFVSHNSTAVHTLQSLGYPALETFFTNQYKHAMYSTYLQKLEERRVKIYSVDEGGWLERMKREMKYLQRSVAGNYVYYHHPSSGPVQNDDFCDSPANLVHRLSLRAFPTMQTTADSRKRGSHVPPGARKGPRPITTKGVNRDFLRRR